MTRDNLGRFVKGITGNDAGHWKGGLWGVEVVCPYCKVQYRVPECRIKQTKSKKIYCCREHWKLDTTYEFSCKVCGKTKRIKKSDLRIKNRGQYCSKSCRGKELSLGEKNACWKGGRILRKDGYIDVLVVGTGKYVREHRLVMSVVDNPDVHVHHINGIRNDNRPENLVVLTPSEHHTLENNKRWGNL